MLLDKNQMILPKRKLNWLEPRDFQKLILLALEDGYRYVLIIVPRRSGKDLGCLDTVARKMIENPGNYYYAYPRFNMGRRGLWECITVDGKPYMSLFPKDRIIRKDNTSMFLSLRNDHGSISTFQVLGMDDPENIPSMNVHGIVLSEYKRFKPRAFQLLQPIFNNNPKCWCLINSTTYGRNNHLWDLKESALKHPDFFYIYLTLDDIKHIPVEMIERDIKAGIISRDLALQEYWCSWDMGIDGTYYGHLVDNMEEEERITNVLYDSRYPVYTACDIGRMVTIIVYYQLIPRNTIHVIDCTRIERGGISELAQDIKKKNYTYGKHYYPHDMEVEEFGATMKRIQIAETLGIGGKVLEKEKNKQEGIECVRQIFPRTFIDKEKCKELIRALRNYRHEYDTLKGTYSKNPVADWSADWADAFRYVARSAIEVEYESGWNHQSVEEAIYQASLEKNPYR